MHALLHHAPAGAVAVIDARRREVFAEGPGVPAAAYDPAALAALLPPGTVVVGDGALRYRELLTDAGATVPDDETAGPLHRVRADAHCRAGAVRRHPAGAALPARARRDALGGGAMMTGIELRKLKLADIPSIEQVERRAYSTPWSRTMFAGEIAKPTSRCFGAFDGDRLAGYLIVSRYVDAWHIMNVAIDEPYRRRGPGVPHARAAVRRDTRATARAATRSRCASRTTARSGSTSASASSRRASAAGTTPTTARTP